jgi:RecA-family ATPase
MNKRRNILSPGDRDPAELDPSELAPGERYLGNGVILMPSSIYAPLKFERAGDVEPVLEGRWLIHGLLPAQGVAAVYGHSGTAKTFITMDWCAHIASGSPWNGAHVERGLVIYVAAEGQAGFRNRLVALRNAGRFSADDPFVFIPTPIDMLAPDGDCVRLIETIEIAAESESARPVMVVIDTLSKTFGGGKENSDDMAVYLANCQRVASAFECLTLIVHHRPKDSESRDLRGHSSLRAGVDTAILVEGD